MKEYNVNELDTEGVCPTGEIGVEYIDQRWQRNGQRLLCPLSKLILQRQPCAGLWLRAAAMATGWSLVRTMAFKLSMSHITLSMEGKTDADTRKGIIDAKLYDLLFKLSRKTHQPRAD